MRIWDSIRRLSGNPFRKQNTRLSTLGFLKSKKAQKRQLQIEQFEDRILLSINSPELNAIFVNQDENQYFDPAVTNKVYHIAPESFLLRFNEGQELDPTSLATGIEVVRAGTDGKFGTDDDVIVDIGWVGLNGSRGDGKDVITVGDNKTLGEGIVGSEVVIRFSEKLPDDLYQIRLIGSGNSPLKNLQGDVFHDEADQAVSFELDLGAQVVATVPQPTYRGTEITFLAGNKIKDGDKIVISNGRTSTTFEFDNDGKSSSGNVRVTINKNMTAAQVRNSFLTAATPYFGTMSLIGTSSGTAGLHINGYGNSVTCPAGNTQFKLTEGSLGQARDKVVLYFNENDPLYFPGFNANAANAMNRTYTTTNASYLKLFQLIATQNTADSSDDVVHIPSKIEYVPATGEMILTFAKELDKLDGFDEEACAARLRVGTLYEQTETSILEVNYGDLPGDAFHTSFDLVNHFDTTKTVTGPQSLVIHGQIEPKYDPTEYTGARDEPGHRDLPTGLGLGGENHINGDTIDGSKDLTDGPTIRYYNFKSVLGYDNNGQPYNNVITEKQKDLARQIFQMYSRYLGIEFIEDTNPDNPRGTTIATGDLRFLGPGYTSAEGGVAGLGGPGIALMDMMEPWVDIYGGNWFQVAMHEIGHALYLGHTYDLPDGTVMGSTSLIDGQVKENTFPGDYDILHGQYIFRPDSTDVDLYKFVVEPGQRGMFNAEVYAQRQNATSLLDSTLTLYRQITATDGSIYYEMVSRNDDYFGKDSFLETYLTEGVYFIGVASSGNDQYTPELEGTGEGGTTSGNYELRLTFTPGGVNPEDSTTYKEEQSKTSLVDATGVKFDGDHDGTPGGEFNFWFNVQKQEKTIYVDKIAPAGGNGSLAKPYNTIKDAISNSSEGDIIRIVGNNYANDYYDDGSSNTSLQDNYAYEIGTNNQTNKVLSDGATFDVPRGVTVVIDAGAVLKFSGTNINVGSFAQNVDRSGGSIQVLGTPTTQVVFTAYTDQTIGVRTNELDTVAKSGDWGGISIRNDYDYEFINSYDPASGKKQREVLEEQGIFLNYISNGVFRYGGGKASGGGQENYSPINLNTTRATVAYNTITKSGNAAISADLSSFEETRFQSWDHDQNTIYTLDYTRVGPDVHGNTVKNNAVNGLAVRAVATASSSSAKKVTGNIRFDDTDIVHVLQENIVLQGTTGEYSTTEVTAPSLSDAYAQYGIRHTTSSNATNDLLYDNTIYVNSTPKDGEYFSLSDGTTNLVFEFNHIDKQNHGGVKQGRVQIDINSTDSPDVVMQKLITVINSLSGDDYLANYKKFIPNGGSQMTKPFKITASPHAVTQHTIVFVSSGTELEILGTGLVKSNIAASMMVDPGIIFKANDIRIEAEMGAHIIAEGNAAHQIVITSLYDNRFGASGSYITGTKDKDPNYLPKGGDWGGLFFGPDSSGSLDHVLIAFAGGISGSGGSNFGFNPVEIHQADVRIANGRFEHNTGVTRGDDPTSGRGSATPAVIFVRGAQPVIVNNQFFNNTNSFSNSASALSIISVNANALTDESVIDWGRSTGPVSNYSEYNDNYGPLVRNNTFTGNSVNGMVVRGEVMTVSGIWDDADIAHILYNEIKVGNYHSGTGLRLMSAPGQSLVVKLLGNNAGFTTLGSPIENADRIGGAIQIIGVSKYPVVLTSLKDDSVGAGRNLKGQVMFDTNNDDENTKAAPGDWRSVKFDSYSNDRNVMVITELEKNANESEDRNGTTALAQYLGRVATEDKVGDDVYHLGYEIYGSIRSDAPNESDVYSFKALPGTEIWIDIDKTTRDLDLIVEIIDANGKLLARSDNGYLEELGYGEVEANEGVSAFTMNKDRWNRMDFYSINQRDPGLRFVTPGAVGGEEKTYYVRVRSALGATDVSNVTQANSDGEHFVISQGDKTYTFVFDYNRNENDAAYLAANKVNGHFIVPMKGVANTEAAKQQAIVNAINKTYEVHAAKAYNDNYGQGIVTARIAYYFDGNYISGANPRIVSNIVLDGAELNFIALDTGLTVLANSSGSYRLQLRLQETDEVPGCSVMYADIRYAVNGIEAYGFPQNSPIQAEYKDVAGSSFAGAGDLGNLLGSNSGTISVSGYMTQRDQVDWYKFSLNYRDIQMIPGSSNAGNIWSAIFDIDYADGSGPDLTLWVFDSGGRLIYVGTDSNVADDQYDPNLKTNLEKLSAGSNGAYDPFIGPAGLVAGVDAGSGNSQTYYVAVTSAATYADVLNHTNTRLEPIDSIQRVVEERVDQGQDMDNAWNDNEVEAAQRLTLTPDEYHLGDVVTYVGTNGGLYIIDPFTGITQLERSYVAAFPNNCGIDLRDNGKLYTFGGAGNVPNFYEINQAQVSSQVSSISTQVQGKWYYLNGSNVVWRDSSYQVKAMATSNYGTTYQNPNYTQQGFTFSIGTVSGFSQSLYDDQTGAVGNNNVLFMHSADGVGISRNRENGLDEPAASGTNQACSSSLVWAQFSEKNGLRSNNEIITSLTQGNDGNFYVVTDDGNLYRMDNYMSRGWSLSVNIHIVGDSIIEVPAMRSTGGGPTLTYIGTCKDDNERPLDLTGIAAGPQNVENGAYADKLFIISSDGKLRAVAPREQNSVGSISYSPVFYGGNTSVNVPANTNSITFSSIDYNLWHRTSLENDPVQSSPSLVRTEGGNGGDNYPHNGSGQRASWYFGLENPTTGGIWRDSQPGSEAYTNRFQTGNTDSLDTYNVPGGAYGSLTSDSFSLYGYSPEDKPALYFTYLTDSDSSGSFANTNDLPAVYISVDGGNWIPVAVGNAYANEGNGNNYWNRTNEAKYSSNNELQRDNDHYIDILENVDEWRQAKVDLSQFSGYADLRLKFVFSTAGGDIGIGDTAVAGNVAGSLITAPKADQLLDSGWRRDATGWLPGRVQKPGDGSLDYSNNSYYTIGNKTFQFVSGYSLYVPASPSEYGDTLKLTINGREVTIPLDKTAGADQIIAKIISAINNENIQDNLNPNATVVAKRYVDTYGKASGQMIYFENANNIEVEIDRSGGYVLIGGPQDRTLEEIFSMTASELASFLSQGTIPVPFRPDMTQSEIAGSITFMTNLAFNDLLNDELNQNYNSYQAMPHIEELLNDLRNMSPSDNVIAIINNALSQVRNTGSTKAISFLVSLVEKLNVEGKYNSVTRTGVVSGIEREINILYNESSCLVHVAVTTLRDQSTLNDAQRAAFNTAINSLNTNRTSTNAVDPNTILQTLRNALGGNDANVTAARNGVINIQEMLGDYVQLHRISQLQQYLSEISGRIPSDVFQELDNLSRDLSLVNPQVYSDIILSQLNTYRVNWNQNAAHSYYLALLDTARVSIAQDPENMYTYLRNMTLELGNRPQQVDVNGDPVFDEDNNPVLIEIPNYVTNNINSTFDRLDLYFTSLATFTSNELNIYRTNEVSNGAHQDVLNLLNSYRIQIATNPEDIFILLDNLGSELNDLKIALENQAIYDSRVDRAIAKVTELRDRAADFVAGEHVSDDLDALSVNLKAIARNTAIADVSQLLDSLESHVKEMAVDTINRVLNTNLISTDPRKLITLFQRTDSLLEKNLRIDTSVVSGVVENNSFTTGLKSTTNSVQMSLVNLLSVGHAGPLNVQNTGLNGTQSNGLTKGNSLEPIYRSQNNQNGGIFIDNIIIGFAGRGEMVTNAPSNTSFTTVNAERSYVTQGSYQLEIRRGTEYASYSSGFRSSANATIETLFDINERHSEGISFFAPSSAEVAHNQKFSISDGVNTLTFVFINTKFGGGAGDDIKIEFTDGDSAVKIANTIKDAINTAFKKGLFKVTASTGSLNIDINKTHLQVDLFNATDFRNLVQEGSTITEMRPIQHVFYGASTGKQHNDGTITGNNGNEVVMRSSSLEEFRTNAEATRLYVDPNILTRTGDSNTVRQKGQLTLLGNSISHSSDYAIKIAPGDNPVAVARQQADYRVATPLIPGIAITNNVLAFNNTGAISIEGLADAIPFVRILNNTVYGQSVAVGTGVSLGSNTAATILNNVFANLNTGIALNGANPGEIVYRSNTYRGNNTNGEDTSVGNQNRAQEVPVSDPLFVSEERGNFYPAENSVIIDSAAENWSERNDWYIAALKELGIPESKIYSPEYDMYGQLRNYDQNSSSGGTGGSNPGYDRGAIERVDFEKPTSALGVPHDVTTDTQVGNSGDQDPNRNDVYLIAEYLNRFTIQLSDMGIGIDDLSVADNNVFVHEHVVTLIESTWDGAKWVEKELKLNVDYFANYNTANDLITLTPNSGQWSSDARYKIVLNNNADGICDLAGNPLNANRADGTTTFNIVTTGYDYGDAPDPKYPTLVPSDGPRHVVYHGYQLGDRVSVDYSPNASTNADGDAYDDGVKLSTSDLVTGKENVFLVKISDLNEIIKANRGNSTTIGWLSFWIDWDDSGEFSSAAAVNGYQEYYQLEITQDMLDNADENGYIQIKVDAPRFAADGTTELIDSYVFARFRFSSQKDLGPNGAAPDGEVEDYRFQMVRNLKTYGDAPANYTPENTMDGWHATDLLWGCDKNDPSKPMQGKESELVPGSGQQLHLGDLAPSSKSKPNNTVDASGNGDEDDGVDFSDLWFVAEEKVSFKVKVNVPDALKDAMRKDSSIKIYLNGWFDTNCDQVWSDAEHLVDNMAIGLADIDANGYVTVTVTVPDDAARGQTFARLRVSTSKIDTPHGPELTSDTVYDGEIEDYMINALDQRRDFGNAPGDENTKYDNGGAAHVIVRDKNGKPQLALGNKVEEETDGRPAKDFEDHKANVPADNDGLVDCRLVIGEKSFLIVTVTNTTLEDAYLNVWIDLNNNGKFDDASEQILKDYVVKAGTPAGTQITIELAENIPAELVHVEDDPDTEEDESVKESIAIGEKFMRMRLSHQAGIGPRGSSIEIGGVKTDIDGEVEDYVIVLQKTLSSINGNVYQDLNADGTRQSIIPPTEEGGEATGFDEAGLAGLIVYIDINGDGKFGRDQFGQLEPYAVVDEDGHYELNGIWNSIYDETYKVRVLKDVSELSNDTGLAQTVIDAYKELLSNYDEYILTTLTYQYEVSITSENAVSDQNFGFFAKPRLSINDLTVIEGNLDEEDAAVQTEIEMEIKMRNKYGTNIMADVWVAYDTVLTTLGLRLTDAGLKYRILVSDASTGDFVEVSHAADAFTTDTEGVVTINEGWLKLVGGEYAEYTGKIKLIILGDVDVEQDEAFNVDLSVDSYVDLLKDLVAEDGKTSVSSIILEKGTGQVVLINDDGDLNTGTAPEPYGPRTLEEAEARHQKDSGLHLGASDDTPDGIKGRDRNTTSATVSLDDFVFLAGAGNRLQATVTNTTGKQAYLFAWMDLNGDGVWDPDTEQVIGLDGKGIKVNPGVNTVTVTLPADAAIGETYIRFRISSGEVSSVGGMSLDGEVEDYKVAVVSELVDLGSAPESYGNPSHKLQIDSNGNMTGPYLGKTVSPEYYPDYRPTAGASDDDGVKIPSYSIGGGSSHANALLVENYTTITVNASQAGVISLWIDMNGNGVFDTDERIALRHTGSQTAGYFLDLKAGNNSIDVYLPDSQLTGTIQTFARFRFTGADVNHDELLPTGYAASGEVEDYYVTLLTKGSTVSGMVYHDMNADGKYGKIELPKPDVNVTVRQGKSVPFLTGDVWYYERYYYMPGLSSYPQQMTASHLNTETGEVETKDITIQIGGKTYDAYIVTDKGAVMLLDYDEYYNDIYGVSNTSVPSLYSGNAPTFAPFLSNMVDATVRYTTGFNEDGQAYIMFQWNDDFGVCITDYPAYAGEGDAPEGYVEGDIVTYFYSSTFIESLRQMNPTDYQPVQVGTNFAAYWTNSNDMRTYVSHLSLMYYLDGLAYASIPNPDYVPPTEEGEGEEGEDPVVDPEPEFIAGTEHKYASYRLNPEQGNEVYQPVNTTDPMPEHVFFPTVNYMQQIYISSTTQAISDAGHYYFYNNPNTLKSSAVQSFGFWFEYGGQRYDSYVIYDNASIGLINSNGYVDAYIELGMSYTATTPTVDVQTGTSSRGNSFVQIRWNSKMGIIIENDPTGDIVSLFFAKDGYPKGVNLGGSTTTSTVYTDPDPYSIGFRYSDGTFVNVLSDLIDKDYIENSKDYDAFFAASGGQLTYRLSATTGRLYHNEPGLQGVMVYIDANNNGRWDVGEPMTRSDASGYYEFTGLYPGTYVIRQDIENDPELGSGSVSTANGWIQTGPKVPNAYYNEAFVDEQHRNSENNFGNFKKGNISITDTKVVEGTGGNKYVNIDVELRDAFGALITYDYVTKDGTAFEGEDYIGKSGTATISPQLAPTGQWRLKTAVTDMSDTQLSRSVSGDFIAYESYVKNADGKMQWKVFIYNSVTDETFSLTDKIGHGNNDRMPSILQIGDSLKLVWSSYDPNSKTNQVFYSEATINDLSQFTANAFENMSTGSIFPVSNLLEQTKLGDNMTPQISAYQKDNGEYDAVVTWICTLKNGQKEVFCIDSIDAIKHGLSSNIRRVTNNYVEETNVVVDGKNIVWIQDEGYRKLMLYRVGESTSPIAIPTGEGSSFSPTISGDYIAWQQTYQQGTTSEWSQIMYYRISTGIVSGISYDYYYTAGYNGQAPCINGDWLVWQEPASTYSGENGKYDVMAYNVKTGVLRNVSVHNINDDVAPQVVGNRLVWQSYFREKNTESLQWHIQFVDLDIDSFIPVTLSKLPDAAPSSNWVPVLTENMVVWRATNSTTGKHSIMVAKQDETVAKGTLQIEIIGDSNAEDDEYFSVILTGVQGELATLTGQTEGKVTILNDDGGEYGLDFGDAPASYGTLLENDGARHVIKYVEQNGIRIPLALYKEVSGSTWVTPVDKETDGQPNANADGDNNNLSNDENGVEFLDSWIVGDKVCIKVYATAACYLNAWVDWNGNGRFGDMTTGISDLDEQVISGYELRAGENEIYIDIPSDAKVGKTYARFRVSSQRELKWFGSAPDGEVEDYAVSIVKSGTSNAGKLVYVEGDTLVVKGTAMNDTISIVRNAGNIVVTHNDGKAQTFAIAENGIRHVDVNGFSGNDIITYQGWASEEHNVVMKPFEAVISTGTLEVNIVNSAKINFIGKSGNDKVTMYDSPGDDEATLKPNQGEMKNGVYTNSVSGVKRITAYAARGGNDSVTFTGSEKSDYLTSWGNSISIFDTAIVESEIVESQIYYNRAIGFGTASVDAVANANTNDLDVASVFERTDAGVSFHANPVEASMNRQAVGRDLALSLMLNSFNTVNMSALGGDNYAATIYGSEGNDTLVATDTQIKLSGQRSDGANYTIMVNNFNRYTVDASGGRDTVSYSASQSGNHLLAEGRTLKVFSENQDITSDNALLELLAFESAKFDSAGYKATKNTTNINDKLIQLDMIGDWVEKNS